MWEARAKKAKAEHKEMYPNYRFRPVHNKNKSKQKKDKMPLDEPDERRCEEVAQLLLEGKKGDELLAAVRRLDLDRHQPSSSSASPMLAPYPQLAMPAPMYPLYHHRRSSSAPPGHYHGPIAVPTLDFFPSHASSRADTPVSNIARAYRDIRRPSSAGPSYYMDWTMPAAPVTLDSLQPDNEPLPDVNTDFFNPGFTGMSGFGGAQNNVIFVSRSSMLWNLGSPIRVGRREREPWPRSEHRPSGQRFCRPSVRRALPCIDRDIVRIPVLRHHSRQRHALDAGYAGARGAQTLGLALRLLRDAPA